MPLSLRNFLICFVGFCVAFVPVLYWAGLYASIEPASALVLHISQKRLNRLSWLMGIHVSVYVALFTGVGALTYVLIRRLPWRRARIVALISLLSLPVLCSFLRVLTYSSIQGGGGTYTFWTAIERYFERRRLAQMPPPRETSSSWQASQISLTGEWHPSVALRAVADSLEDYLGRTDLSMVSPRALTLYLDNVLSEEIAPQHRAAYAEILAEIFARAERVASAREIKVRRGFGSDGFIEYGPRAEPKLIVTSSSFHRGNAVTITNMARVPYSWVRYEKGIRGSMEFRSEEPFP